MKAFTLIEAMIGVTILTFAVAGPLFSANRAIVATMIARDQLTASYLAQEGVEYVRAMRDNEFLAAYESGEDVSNVAWTNFLTAATSCRSPKICTLGPMQSGTLALVSCPGNTCSTTFSLLSGGTPFMRTVQAIDVSANEETVVSTVEWSYHDILYTVTISDHLTPWQ